LLGTVFLYVDYSTSVEAIRTKGQEVVAASPLWDKRVFAVQTTDWKANAVEVRILVSAQSAPQLFDLRCQTFVFGLPNRAFESSFSRHS
jgi:hypothetical protein